MTEASEAETQTEFTFDQLSERAKEKARDKEREHACHDEWWDHTYEDAVRMGALMGIFIGTCGKKAEIDINFSGFCSQGDDASFAGQYKHTPNAVANIVAECGGQDSELIRIASELTAFQVANQMQYGTTVSARIGKSGRSSNSMTMNIEVTLDNWNDVWPNLIDDVFDDLGAALITLMRDFADWIYKQLETEYDYLNSDEYIDQILKDGVLFDEDGDRI